MRRLASCIFCAILRRRPITGIASSRRRARRRGAGARRGAARAAAAATCGVEVGVHDAAARARCRDTARRSMPSSHARRRTAGEASGRSPVARRRIAGAALAAGAGAARRGAGAGAGVQRRLRRVAPPAAPARRRRRAAGRRRRAARHVARAFDLDADQLRADRHRLPDLAAEREHRAGHRRRDLDRRLVGHHVGQHLVLGHRVAGLARARPTSSTSAMPSPMSGILMTWMPIAQPPSRAATPRRRAPGPGK